MKSFNSFSRATIISLTVWHATLLGSILLVATNLRAQTEVQADWISTGVERYSIATNWSTGTVPNNDSSFVYNVAINQGVAVSDQNATINSLKIGSTGRLQDFGAGSLSGGTITAGTMVNDGFVGYSAGGALNVSGDFTTSGSFSMGNNNARATVGNTYNSGSMTSSGVGGLITVNGTLTNTAVVHTGFVLSVNGDLINTGTVSVDNFGVNRISGNVCNSGTYALGRGEMISGIVLNHGTMSTPGPPGGVVNIGTLDNDNDGLLRIGGSFRVGEISNSGTMGLGGVIDSTKSFAQDHAGIWQEQSGAFGFGTASVTDSISLDGTLDLSSLANVHLTLGQSFDLATFPPGNLFGAFSAIVGNSFSSGTLMFQINYDESAGRIRLTVVPAGSQEVVFTP